MIEASLSNRASTLSLKECQKEVTKTFGDADEDDFCKQEIFTRKKINNKRWESCQLLSTLGEGLTAAGIFCQQQALSRYRTPFFKYQLDSRTLSIGKAYSNNIAKLLQLGETA